MKKYSTVFGNLLSHICRSDFEKAVKQYSGDRKTRTLSSFDLLKTLLYGQTTSSFSVREIESALDVNFKKLYHCGMKPVRKSTLYDAMEKRDPRIFQSTFEALVGNAQLVSGTSGKDSKIP